MTIIFGLLSGLCLYDWVAYRRADSMYRASVKVSPLDACPELISRATSHKFWYVGHRNCESHQYSGDNNESNE